MQSDASRGARNCAAVADAILEAAAEHGAGLIVLGRRGMGATERCAASLGCTENIVGRRLVGL